MDEIYGNLENYNEVNALAELRSENQELKAKLQEYTTSMDKLQKDFDKLTTEFKKLECNYSSLLKTARAEIERKTQIITNLNVEKDVLICKTLQNGNKSVLSYKRDVANQISKSVKNDDSVINKNKTKKTQEVPTQPQHESENERFNSHGGRTSESKENIQQNSVPNTDPKPRALSIKSRRKSMPAVSMQEEKFSSDEEYYNPAEHGKEYSMKNNVNKNISDRRYNHKFTNKVSESSSIDDKTSGYYESSRETYNSRNTRYYADDKYRNIDKYDYSQRYRRDYSPDRYNRRRVRDYQTDNSQRLEYNRHRVLVSPSKDAYNYSHRYKGYRPNYSRDQYNEQDRYKHYQDRYSVKHKIVSDHDEPCTKRKKIDPYGNYGDTNWYEREFSENQTIADTFEQLESQYTSCQSPDYIYTDLSEPIKEIKNTAATQLEDPRLTSKKYSLKTHDDKTFLSTVNNMNIDLRRINKSMWGIEKVAIPPALLQQPAEGDLKDNPETNMFSDSSGIPYGQDGVVNGHPSISKVKYQTSKSYPVNDYKKILSQCSSENNTQTEEDLQLKLIYELPDSKTSSGNKTKLSNINKNESPNVTDISDEYYDNYKNDKDRNTEISKGNSPWTTIGDNSIVFDSDGNGNKNNNTFHDTKCHDSKQVIDDESYLSTNKGVEGDLELSDETCDDNTDLEKVNANNSRYNKTAHVSCSNQGDEWSIEQKTCTSKEKTSETHIKTYIKKNNILKLQKEEIVTEEKTKSKKKLQQTKDEATEKAEKNIVSHKKAKRKRERVKSKEERPKLQDLFGETSVNSLITPDDLGIVAVQSNKKSTTSIYTSIFEDAQDAIELIGTNLEMENTGSTKLIDVINNDTPKTDAAVLSQGNDVEPILKNKKASNETVGDDDINTQLDMIYENLEPISKETDAVKTVIISTGCQPDIPVEEHVKNAVDPTRETNDTRIQETFVNNLATSTPYKELHQHNTLESDSKILDSSCNSSDIRLGNDVTNSDTLDTKSVTDVPDVRIFVRRKRKFMKKPLGT